MSQPAQRRLQTWSKARAVRLLILENDPDLGDALTTGLRQADHAAGALAGARG